MQKDKDLQNRFANYGAVPSDNVWMGIENALDKKKRKPLFWWWVVGLIGVTGFTFATITSSFSTEAGNADSVVKSYPSEKSSQYQFSTASAGEKQLQKVESNPSNEQNHSNGLSDIVCKDEKSNTNHSQQAQTEIKDPSFSILRPLTPSENSTTGKRRIFENSEVSKLDFLKPSLFLFGTPAPNRFLAPILSQSKWRFGIQYGGFTAMANTFSSFSSQNLDSNAIVPQGLESINSSIRHFIPLQLSLQAEYVYSNRISLLFGVGYTRFAQAITPAGQTEQIKSFRTHTFDIPVQMNFNFVSRKRFQMYFGLGVTSSVYLPTQSTSNTNVSALAFLGRISGAFGTRIDLTENIAFNIQPTCQYGLFDTSGPIGKRQFMYGATAGIFFKPKILKSRLTPSK